MAIFHKATNKPAKLELIEAWLPSQPWGPGKPVAVERVGSFHLEDPEGEVGIQAFILRAAGELYFVPLTYRAEPLDAADESFVATMEHSVLGTRYLYDAFGDERFLVVMAGVAACGYGQTLGFANTDDRWSAWLEDTLLHGHGSVGRRVLVDGFTAQPSDASESVFRNEELEMTIWRRLSDRPLPAIGCSATWMDQAQPVALVSIEDLHA